MQNIVKSVVLVVIMLAFLVAGVIIVVVDSNKNTSVDEMLVEANVYYSGYDYDNAIAIYNRILNSDSSCSEAYVGLSTAYYSKKNYDKSLQVLEKGMEYAADKSIVEKRLYYLFPEYSETSESETEITGTEQ